MNTSTFLQPSHSTPTCLWRWNRQSVPKRRHIKSRRRGITQRKAYNIQNTAKVWNQGCRCYSEWAIKQNQSVVIILKNDTYINTVIKQHFQLCVCSFILLSILWQFYSLFQSEFSTDCDLVLLLPISTIFSFLTFSFLSSRHFYSSLYFFPSIMCFTRQFPRKMSPIQLELFFVCVCDIPLLLDSL